MLFVLMGTHSVKSQTATRWNGNEYTNCVSTSTDFSSDNVVYLYNVKTGRFAINGYSWGTGVAILHQDYGLPMFLRKDKNNNYYLETNMQNDVGYGQGNCLGLTLYSKTSEALGSEWDGWFFDRSEFTKNIGTETQTNYVKSSSIYLSFDRVESEGDIYSYYISTTADDITYYLSSNGENSVATTEKQTGEEGQWRLVTRAQLKQVLEAGGADLYSGLNADLTYLIHGNEFGRGDKAAQNYWKTSNSGTSTSDGYRYDWRKDPTPTDTKVFTTEAWNNLVLTFAAGNGTQDEEFSYGRYYNAALEGVGKVYQTITVPKAGWYKLTCQGFFAGSESNLYVTVDGKTYSTLLNDYTDKEDFALVEEANENYYSVKYLRNSDNGITAGKLFAAGKCPNEVWFYVESANKSVTIGVEKTGANQSSEADATKTDSGTKYYYHDTDYTAFDNFQLKFIGQAPFELDENATSIDYMKEDFENRTILLKRSFTLGSWNSLVLPVDMTSAQVKQAFGADVELARLEGLDETDNMIIKFATVDLPADGTVIEAGKLYIIKPTVAAPVVNYTIGNTTYSGACYTLGRRNFEGTTIVEKGTEVIECKRTQESHPNDIAAYGTYVKLNTEDDKYCPAGAYVFSGGNMYNTVSDLSIKGFRGWIEDTQLSAGAKSFRVSLDGASDVTAVDGVKLNTPAVNDGRVFDMSGRLVRKDGSIKELPAGIYIVNHKKVVKK